MTSIFSLNLIFWLYDQKVLIWVEILVAPTLNTANLWTLEQRRLHDWHSYLPHWTPCKSSSINYVSFLRHRTYLTKHGHNLSITLSMLLKQCNLWSEFSFLWCCHRQNGFYQFTFLWNRQPSVSRWVLVAKVYLHYSKLLNNNRR